MHAMANPIYKTEIDLKRAQIRRVLIVLALFLFFIYPAFAISSVKDAWVQATNATP